MPQEPQADRDVAPRRRRLASMISADEGHASEAQKTLLAGEGFFVQRGGDGVGYRIITR
jgi:hypothetical protein